MEFLNTPAPHSLPEPVLVFMLRAVCYFAMIVCLVLKLHFNRILQKNYLANSLSLLSNQLSIKVTFPMLT